MSRIEHEPLPPPPVGWQAPLVDLLAALAAWRWLVLAIVASGIGMAAWGLANTPPYWRSSVAAKLLPREKPHLDLSLRVGGVDTGRSAAQRDETGSLMLPADAALYTELLRSAPILATVREQLAESLAEAWPDEEGVVRLETLAAAIEVRGEEGGLLHVTVTAPNAHVAADLANALLHAAQEETRKIERQLVAEQTDALQTTLTELRRRVKRAEDALRAFHSRHRVLDLESQTHDALQRIRELEQHRLGIEEQLVGRRRTHTDDDPQVAALVDRLATVDRALGTARRNYLGGVSERQAGEIRLELEALTGRVAFLRDLETALAGQLEVFRIRGDQPSGALAVVRPAVAAVLPAGPRKSTWLGVGGLVGIALAVLAAIVLEQWRSTRGTPYLRARLAEVRSHLSGAS